MLNREVGTASGRRWQGGRLPRAEVEQRIERLLDIALEEFTAQGFGGTSLDRLVEQSGVSKTTIYRRFGNKEGLFKTLLDRSLAGTHAELWSVRLDQDDPLGTVTRFVKAYTEVTGGHLLGQALLRIAIAEKATFPDLSRELLHNGRRGFEPISDYFAKLMSEGVLRTADPLEAAFELQALITQGFRVMVDDLSYLYRPGRAEDIARKFLKGWS